MICLGPTSDEPQKVLEMLKDWIGHFFATEDQFSKILDNEKIENAEAGFHIQ